MELTLFVDHQCNLRCTYCYTGDKFNKRMSFETAQKAVDFALSRPQAHLDISLFGGEPLIHLDFLKEVSEYAEKKLASIKGHRPTLRYILNTNATLINDASIEWLKGRTTAVFISLDGTKQTHDRFRIDAGGKGTFDSVMRGIERLRQAQIPFQIVAVINTVTCNELGATVTELLPSGANKIILSPNFRDEWTEESIEALRGGLLQAGQTWMKEFREGRPFPLDPLHTKILTHLKGGIPCPVRCQLAGEELCIAPSGNIYPCAQMVGEDKDHELVIGHIDSGLLREKIHQLQQAKDRVEDTCAPCALRDRCQSHCGCRHVALTGKLGEITAALCEVESAFIDAADAVAETLFAEQCPAFIEYYYKRNWVAAKGGTLTQLRKARDN
jgi:uncharacterized protein